MMSERYTQLYKFECATLVEEMKKTRSTYIKRIVYYPLLTFICFELALLILGYRRYQTEPYKVEAVPENAYIADRELGIALNPGTYQITLNDSVQFTTTHTVKGQRYVPQPSLDSAQVEITLLGCSFTYGYGVNDDETFAALLQKKHPQWRITNEAVIGYGTVQSYLQIQQIITEGKTDVVLLNFSSYHFIRNVLSQAYRKNLKIGYAHSARQVDSLMQEALFPYITNCDCTVKYAGWEDMHENWAGREWFASVNWIQTFYERYLDSKTDPVALTSCLIQKMHEDCTAAGIKFGVVCLDRSPETETLKNELNNLPWQDVCFDFTDPKCTHLPYDSHPNAIGHAQIATSVDSLLNRLM